MSDPIAHDGIPHPVVPWQRNMPMPDDDRWCANRIVKLPAGYTCKLKFSHNCSECSRIYDSDTNTSGHLAFEGAGNYGTPGMPWPTNPYRLDRIREIYQLIAQTLSWAYKAGMAIPDFGIYNAEGSYNFSEFAQFNVYQADGVLLTLEKGLGLAPLDMMTADGWHSSLAPGSTVTHFVGMWEEIPMYGRAANLMHFDLSGLHGGGNTFQVTLSSSILVEPGDMVRIRRYTLGEPFVYPTPYFCLPCETLTIDKSLSDIAAMIADQGPASTPGGEMTAAGWLFLRDSAGGMKTRIAYPKRDDQSTPYIGTFRVRYHTGSTWVDHTGDFIDSNGPVATKLILFQDTVSTLHEHYSAIRLNLAALGTSGVDRVEIRYMPQSPSGDGFHPYQMLCSHCIRDFSNSIAHYPAPGLGIDNYQKHWFCEKRNESGMEGWRGAFRAGECYMTGCPFFEINRSFAPDWRTFAWLVGASGPYLRELVVGISDPSNYLLGRGPYGIPSLGFLTGSTVFSAEGLPGVCRVDFQGHGMFGWPERVTRDDGDDTIWHNSAYDANFGGVIAQCCPELAQSGPYFIGGFAHYGQGGGEKPIDWNGEEVPSDLAQCYWQDSDDPQKVHRATPGRRMATYVPGDSSTPWNRFLPAVTGEDGGEFAVQEVVRRIYHFPKIDATKSPVTIGGEGIVTAGTWSNVVTGRTFGLKVALWNDREFGEKVRGEIYAVEQSDDLRHLKLWMKPGQYDCWYAIAGQDSFGSSSYMAGGNIVAQPIWKQPSNPGTDKARYKWPHDLAMAHDSARILGIGYDDHKMTVIHAIPSEAGVTYSGASAEPQGPGFPAGFETWRKHCDMVVLDLSSGSAADAYIAEMNNPDDLLVGKTIVFETKSITRPVVKWDGSAADPDENWNIDQATICIWQGEDRELTAEEYFIDRANGVLCIDKSVTDLYTGSEFCLLFRTWVYDRKVRRPPSPWIALLRAVRKCCRFMSPGVVAGVGRLQIKTVFGPVESAMTIFDIQARSAYPNRIEHYDWPAINAQPKIIVLDSPVNFEMCPTDNQPFCEWTGAYRAKPNPDQRVYLYPEEDVGIYGAGAGFLSYALPVEGGYYQFIPWDPGFGGSLPYWVLGSVGTLAPEDIVSATVEMRVTNGTMSKYRMQSSQDGVTEEISASGAPIGLVSCIKTPHPTISGAFTLQGSAGATATFSDNNWVRLDITASIKAAMGVKRGSGSEFILFLTGGSAGTITDAGNFNDLSGSWIDTAEFNQIVNPIDPARHMMDWTLEWRELTFESCGLRNFVLEIAIPDVLPPHDFAKGFPALS